MGGSQLNQLKARLRAEGVADRRQLSKQQRKRKRGGARQATEDEARRREKLEAIAKAFNPFDEKVTKPKHEVLGRKVKGAVGRPGAAKEGAMAQRMATLLPELQNRHRSGAFVDRRFGEGDQTMTPEEKMLERFTREQQRRVRGSDLFNLDIDDEAEQLTHFGQSLSGLDDLDDVAREFEEGVEDANGNIDSSTTSRVHFGGFDEASPGQEDDGDEDEELDRKKSKAEVMKEIMAKSKLAKLERQQIKQSDEELRAELDDELDDIRGLLFDVPKAKTEALDAREKVSSGAQGGAIKDSADRTASAAPPSTSTAPAAAAAASGSSSTLPLGITARPKGDSYDQFVRELAFERRAQPQERTKTEAELAAEEAERLRKAEQARLRRMRGEVVDEDAAGAEDAGVRGRRQGKGKQRAVGGDDLEDDFELDGETAADAYGLGSGLVVDEEDGSDGMDDASTQASHEGPEPGTARHRAQSRDWDQDEEGEDEDKHASDQDDEEERDGEEVFDDMLDADALAVQGEDVDISSNDGDDHGDDAGVPLVPQAQPAAKARAAKTDSVPALPFTFACPATHDELLAMLRQSRIQPAQVPTVVKRIRALHHASLAEDNKHKLQAFLGVLLDHALYCAGTSHPPSAAEATGGLRLTNALLPSIFEMSQAYPQAAAQHFVAKLALMQRNLVRGLSRGALRPEARTWPGAAECALLRLAGVVWPTSDLSHPVTSPLALLQAHYLAHSRIRSAADVASCLYLCSLVLNHERDSRRLVPEALNALHSAILVLAGVGTRTGDAHHDEALERVRANAGQNGIPMPDVGEGHTRHLALDWSHASKPSEQARLSLMRLLGGQDEVGEADKQELLAAALSLLAGFRRLYRGCPAYAELFAPFGVALDAVRSCVEPMLAQAATPHPGLTLLARVVAERAELDADVARHVSRRRNLRLQAHRALPLAAQAPKFDMGFNPTVRSRRHFDPDAERAERAKLRTLLKRERKGAVRELRRDAQFVAQHRLEETLREGERYGAKVRRILGSLQEERGEEKALARDKQKRKRMAGRSAASSSSSSGGGGRRGRK